MNNYIKHIVEDFNFNNVKDDGNQFNKKLEDYIWLKNNFVDLGLPSGTLWCKFNLGANTPEEFGDYYAWGENKTKEKYNWDTYKYINKKTGKLIKYNKIDNLSNILPEDDPAYLKDNRMKIPSENLYDELIEQTKHRWITDYNGTGIAGLLFIGNNQELFFPAAGSSEVDFYGNSYIYHKGNRGNYWSCDRNNNQLSASGNDALEFRFNSNTTRHHKKVSMLQTERCPGFNIRPITNKFRDYLAYKKNH